MMVRKELQQNTVQNSHIQMAYDAVASNFSDTYDHHFLPYSNNVDDDVQSPLHIQEDLNPQSRHFFDIL